MQQTAKGTLWKLTKIEEPVAELGPGRYLIGTGEDGSTLLPVHLSEPMRPADVAQRMASGYGKAMAHDLAVYARKWFDPNAPEPVDPETGELANW